MGVFNYSGLNQVKVALSEAAACFLLRAVYQL